MIKIWIAHFIKYGLRDELQTVHVYIYLRDQSEKSVIKIKH